MQIKEVALKTLKPYPGNPRDNSAAVEAVAQSIKEFGAKVPIVIDRDNVIVCGHTRLKAAKRLHMKTFPCIMADDLTPEQINAFRLADNKTAELADWDFAKLDAELAQITDIDMARFGFDAKPAEKKIVDDDFIAEADAPGIKSIVQPGDVWELGRHRLMCGDAMSTTDVQKLIRGGHLDITFTSPPYNMAQGGEFKDTPSHDMGGGRAYGNYSDDLDDAGYSELLNKALDNALAVSDDVMFNIGILQGSKHGIISMLQKHADNFLDLIVWNKSNAMPFGMKSQRGMITHFCEFIFCFNQKGNRSFTHPQWKCGQQKNRIDTRNNSNNEFFHEHHAAFPVAFAAEVVKAYSEKSVLDLFGGTGTTLIACEQMNRYCYTMELDPHYCDIIIQRWELFTGEKAKRIEA